MAELFWLNEVQWATIEPLLPHWGGKPRVDDRRIISGILHRFREGLRWRALPDEYGPRTTAFNRFNRWSERGLWQQLFAALAGCADPPLLAMVDSTAVRAPVSRRRKRGTHKQAIGRSRGCPTAKIHALCDQLGRLYALMLTGGQVHDIWGARGLLACVAAPVRFLGDKAYDADDIRDYLAADGSEAVIPSKANRKEPKPHHPIAYKMRNIIERCFNRLKDWRGIATRLR